MHHKIKAIIFDWDGTLFNSFASIIHAVQEACRDHHYPVPSVEAITEKIGLDSLTALSQLFPDMKLEMLRQLQEAFLVRYVKHSETDAELFPHAESILRQLQGEGYYLAVATAKSRAGLNADLRTLGVKDLFLETRCAEETAGKPDPLMLNEILEELGLSPDEALMVGDSVFDMEMAHYAKVPAVAALYPGNVDERIERARVVGVIHDIQELPDLIKNLA